MALRLVAVDHQWWINHNNFFLSFSALINVLNGNWLACVFFPCCLVNLHYGCKSVYCLTLYLNMFSFNGLVTVNKMFKFHCFCKANDAPSCAATPSFQLMRTIFFHNSRRKQDQLVSFVTKDWQICLVVVVKEMRGCLWQNTCPMKHLQSTFSIVRAPVIYVLILYYWTSNQCVLN